MVQAPEPACVRDWPKYGFPKGTYGPLPKEMEMKANEEMDGFAKLLEGRGIKVDRPDPDRFHPDRADTRLGAEIHVRGDAAARYSVHGGQ